MRELSLSLREEGYKFPLSLWERARVRVLFVLIPLILTYSHREKETP